MKLIENIRGGLNSRAELKRVLIILAFVLLVCVMLFTIKITGLVTYDYDQNCINDSDCWNISNFSYCLNGTCVEDVQEEINLTINEANLTLENVTLENGTFENLTLENLSIENEAPNETENETSHQLLGNASLRGEPEPRRGVTNVSACGTLSIENETYILTQNVSSGETCFTVNANNVTLNCNGFKISYGGTGKMGVGLSYDTYFNWTTVKNCIFSGSSGYDSHGVVIYGLHATVSNNVILDNTDGNSNSNIVAYRADYLTIFNNSLYSGASYKGYTSTEVSSSNNVNISYNNIVIGWITGLSYSGNNSYIAYNNVTLMGGVCYTDWGDTNSLQSTGNNNTIFKNIIPRCRMGAAIYLAAENNTNVSGNTITSTINGGSPGYGIQLFSNSNNNTISGNNVTITGFGYGFYSFSSTNSTLTYNRFNSSGVAVYIGGTMSSHYNQIIDPSNLAEGLPIWYNYSISNITILRNVDVSSAIGQLVCAGCYNVTYDNVTMGNDGFSLFNTSNSLINNSKVTTNNGYGVFFYGSSSSFLQNNLFNVSNINDARSSYLYGIYLLNASGNNISNTNVTTTGTNASGIYLYNASSNNISNSNFMTTGNKGYGIYLDSSASKNLIKDTLISTSYSGVFDINSVGSGINNFTNCTFNRADTNVSSTGSINVFWYADAYVNDTLGNNVSEANVSVYNINNILSGWALTNSTGWTPRITLREYRKNATATYFYTNYSFNGTAGNDTRYSRSVNLTGNKIIETGTPVILTLIYDPAPAPEFGTNPFDSYSTPNSSITFDIKCSSNLSVSMIQLWTNITGTFLANYTNASYTNNTWLNITLDGIPQAQNYKWAIWCNNSINNCAWTDTNRTFTVDALAPVAGFGKNPSDNYSGLSSITFDFKCSDNANTSLIQLWTNTTGTWHANYTNNSYRNNTWVNYTMTGIPPAQNYKWSIWCSDSAGNSNTTENRTFGVYTTPPVMIWENPTPSNGSWYNKNYVYLNITITDALETSAFFDWNKSLVGYWSMDYFNDTGVYDNSSYNHFAEFKRDLSQSQIVPAKYGNGINLNGSTFLNITDASGLNFSRGITVEAWIYHNGAWSTDHDEVVVGQEFNQGRYWFSHEYGSAYWKYFGLGIYDSSSNSWKYANLTSDILPNTWYHVTATYNNSVISLYVNGVLNDTTSWVGSMPYNTEGITIGAERGGRLFKGIIDEVRVYNRALNEQEILASYNNGVYRLETNFTNLDDRDYYYSAYAIDTAGNSNTTLNRTLNVDTTAPKFYGISWYPNTLSDVDPNVTLLFNATVNDSISNISSVLLRYYNGSEWRNVSMILINDSSRLYLVNFTTQTTEANYTINIWANDTAGNENSSANQTINSLWDCNWSLDSYDLGAFAGWDENKFLNNLTIINTGDPLYSNNNCTLDFRLTYDLAEGRIYINGIYLKPSDSFTIAAKSNLSIRINATFLTEIKQEESVITTNEIRSRSLTSSSNTSLILISTQGGPYLYEKIGSYPALVYLTPQNISLESYLRNLMGSDIESENNTAYNVTFNWSLPSNLSVQEGNLSLHFTNITENDLHENNINITFTNLEVMTPGMRIVYLQAQGYNSTGDLIKDVYNNTLLNSSANISFLCYTVSDGYAAMGCWPSDPDTVYCGNGKIDTGETCLSCAIDVGACQTSDNGGSGGGGLSGGQAQKIFQTSERYELLRGKENKFIVTVENPFTTASLDNVTMIVSGFLAQYLSISPENYGLISVNGSRNFTVKITAPNYFEVGSYNLTFYITGIVKVNNSISMFSEKRQVLLDIHDISRQGALVFLNKSREMIQEMNQSKFYVGNLILLYEQEQDMFKRYLYEKVRDLYNNLKSLHDKAYDFEKRVKRLEKDMKEINRDGIQTPETLRLLSLTEVAFSRGDYDTAMSRIKEAELSYAVETKGEFSFVRVLKKNWLALLIALVVLVLLAYVIYFWTRYAWVKQSIRRNLEEERILFGLMKTVQRDCFDLGKMDMGEYQDAMQQYELKLNKVTQKLIELETKKAHFFRFKNEDKRLLVERGKLLELLKETQKLYFERGKFETSIYENKLKSYAGRLSDVEERLALIEAQKALKMHRFLREEFEKGKIPEPRVPKLNEKDEQR